MELEEGEVVVEEAKQPKENKQAKEKPMKSKDKKDKEKSKKKSKKQKEFTSSTYKTKQCEFYKKGGCQKGETCTFSHDFPLEINNTLCRFFLGGACTKENCVFSHEKSKFPCKYYHVLDTCESGTFCQFSHQAMDEETLKAFVQENETFIKDSYQKYGYVKLKIPNLINQPVPNQPKSLASYYYPEQNEIPQPKNNFDNRNVPPLIQRMGAQITTNFNRIATNPNPFSATNPNFQSISGLNPSGSPQNSLPINQIPHPNMTSNFNRPRPNLPMSYPNSTNYIPNPGPFNNMPPPGLNPQHPQLIPQYPPMNSQLAGQFNYNSNATAMNQNNYYQPNMGNMPINLLNTNEINFRNANMNNNFQTNINIGNNITNNQNMSQTIKTDNFSSEKTIDKNVKNHNEIIKNVVEAKATKIIQSESKIVKDVEKNSNVSDKNKNIDNLQTKKKTNDFIKFEKNNFEKKNGNIKRKANSSLNHDHDQQNTKKLKMNDYNQKKEPNNFFKNQINKDQINSTTDFQKDKVKNKGSNALLLNERNNNDERKEIENKDQMLFSNENEDINKILNNIIYKRKIKPILVEESKIKEETEYKIGEKKSDVLKRLDQILKL